MRDEVTLRCGDCGEKAKWVRVTQFSGEHPFCKKCAKQEDDFKESDPSYFYWIKVNRKEKV